MFGAVAYVRESVPEQRVSQELLLEAGKSVSKSFIATNRESYLDLEVEAYSGHVKLDVTGLPMLCHMRLLQHRLTGERFMFDNDFSVTITNLEKKTIAVSYSVLVRPSRTIF
jgi:hypothetical protein